MRSLWLASAAIIISTGVALAQTSGPATPEGSTTATPLTDSGSSGTTATPPPGSNSTTTAPMGTDTGVTTAKPLTDSGSSGSATTPPTNGAASTPSMAPPTATAAAPVMMPARKHYHHSMGMMMAAPANGTAIDYLHYAKGAVMHHNAASADNALSMAETRLLNGVVPQGQIAPDTSPAISSIERARTAVTARKTSVALAAIDMAISQAGGMSTGAMAQPAASMAPPPPHSMMPMNKTPGEMGGAPAVGETSDSGAAAAGGAAHATTATPSPAP